MEAFRPRSQADLAPSGEKARLRANLEAIALVRRLRAEARPAAPEEQQVLARWSGWGAVPALFDKARPEFESARRELMDLVGPAAYASASRSTTNAHYTDAAYTRAIWKAVAELGITGGRVLEPGCGSGTFIGTAPQGVHMVGVELDPTTADIASHLYPRAQVFADSYAKLRLPENAFDAAVGNVPFGDFRLHDPVHNAGKHRIHNHFIIKALHQVRPGGVVAFITSRYTMDAERADARREMARLADLVGAVRLPTGAHRRAAGTDVVTDVLVFRRREADAQPRATDWVHTRKVELDGDSARINAYFADNPHLVLGELALGQGMYSEHTLQVNGDPQAGPALEQALEQVVAHARQQGLEAAGPLQAPEPVAEEPEDLSQLEGRIIQRPDGGFDQIRMGQRVHHLGPKAASARALGRLLGIRDTCKELLEAEAATAEDTDHIARLRADLNRRWDAFVAEHGSPNRPDMVKRPGTDPDTGQKTTVEVAVRPRWGGFASDPDSALVFGLENYDLATGTGTKTRIFTQRVMSPRPPAQIETPADALAVCLEERGRVDVDHIAHLLQTTPQEARQALKGHIFHDPQRGLVAAGEYLSGNVRAKLAAARAAAERDEAYTENVAALQQVVPPDLEANQIRVRMSSAWVGTGYIQQFLAEILNDPDVAVERKNGRYKVKGERVKAAEVTQKWGVKQFNAYKVAEAVLNQATIAVFNDKGVFQEQATEAARACASEMDKAYYTWLWAEPERKRELVTRYNDTFRAHLPRSFDGYRHTRPPGMAEWFTPHPHQNVAAALMVSGPGTGLWHAVGSGKSRAAAMGLMEQRRLGLIGTPAWVVPPSTLEGAAKEFLNAYPNARVLVADTVDVNGSPTGRGDTEAERKADRRAKVAANRAAFLAKLTTNDYDVVILSQNAFKAIPMSGEAMEAYCDRKLQGLRDRRDAAAAKAAADGDERAAETVKELESRLADIRANYDEKIEAIHNEAGGLVWERTGLGYLVVDEIQDYKNLPIESALVERSGSQRAVDLDMKLEWMRERFGPRVICGMTGTPLSNDTWDNWVMMHYLMPEVLEEIGGAHFDDFHSSFHVRGEVPELKVDASRYHIKLRDLGFQNHPDLHGMLRTRVDILMDHGLPVPEVAGGKATNILVERPPEMEQLLKELADRADKVPPRPQKGDDNLLNVLNDGKLAALDMRLIGREASGDNKVSACAAQIAQIWRENRDNVYAMADGSGDSPHPGGLQLVFCDHGTPADKSRKRKNDFDLYAELKALLVAEGMNPERIRFIQEAKNPKKREELLAAARDGHVDVLVGSTPTMGNGVNVQNRAVALHHLDPAWRPDWLEQREGRILRQGNQNPQVQILRYLVRGSFDAFMWQVLERKITFISQMLRTDHTSSERELLIEAQEVLSAVEIRALILDDPRVVEHLVAKKEVLRLGDVEAEWIRGQQAVRDGLESNTRTLERYRKDAAALEQAQARAKDMRGEAFTMDVFGQSFTDRAQAGRALLDEVKASNARWRTEAGRGLTAEAAFQTLNAGHLGGFDVLVGLYGREGVHISLQGVPNSGFWVEANDLAGTDPVHLLQRLTRSITDIAKETERLQRQIPGLEADIASAQAQLEEPWPYRDALIEARRRLDELNAELFGNDAQKAEERGEGEQEAPAPREEGAVPSASGGAAESSGPRQGPGGRTADGGSAARPPADGAPAAEEPDHAPGPSGTDAAPNSQGAGGGGGAGPAAGPGREEGPEGRLARIARPGVQVIAAPGQPVGDHPGPASPTGPAPPLVGHVSGLDLQARTLGIFVDGGPLPVPLEGLQLATADGHRWQDDAAQPWRLDAALSAWVELPHRVTATLADLERVNDQTSPQRAEQIHGALAQEATDATRRGEHAQALAIVDRIQAITGEDSTLHNAALSNAAEKLQSRLPAGSSFRHRQAERIIEHLEAAQQRGNPQIARQELGTAIDTMFALDDLRTALHFCNEAAYAETDPAQQARWRERASAIAHHVRLPYYGLTGGPQREELTAEGSGPPLVERSATPMARFDNRKIAATYFEAADQGRPRDPGTAFGPGQGWLAKTVKEDAAEYRVRRQVPDATGAQAEQAATRARLAVDDLLENGESRRAAARRAVLAAVDAGVYTTAMDLAALAAAADGGGYWADAHYRAVCARHQAWQQRPHPQERQDPTGRWKVLQVPNGADASWALVSPTGDVGPGEYSRSDAERLARTCNNAMETPPGPAQPPAEEPPQASEQEQPTGDGAGAQPLAEGVREAGEGPGVPAAARGNATEAEGAGGRTEGGQLPVAEPGREVSPLKALADYRNADPKGGDWQDFLRARDALAGVVQTMASEGSFDNALRLCSNAINAHEEQHRFWTQQRGAVRRAQVKSRDETGGAASEQLGRFHERFGDLVGDRVAVHGPGGLIFAGNLEEITGEGLRLHAADSGQDYTAPLDQVEMVSSAGQRRWVDANLEACERALTGARRALERGDYPMARAHLRRARPALNTGPEHIEQEWKDTYTTLLDKATFPRDAQDRPVLQIEQSHQGKVRLFGAGGRRAPADQALAKILYASPKLLKSPTENAYVTNANWRPQTVQRRLTRLRAALEEAGYAYQMVTEPDPDEPPEPQEAAPPQPAETEAAPAAAESEPRASRPADPPRRRRARLHPPTLRLELGRCGHARPGGAQRGPGPAGGVRRPHGRRRTGDGHPLAHRIPGRACGGHGVRGHRPPGGRPVGRALPGGDHTGGHHRRPVDLEGPARHGP